MPPETFRCAQASADQREPLPGTASRVRRWLLVEQPGPWGREAILECRMERDTALALEANCRQHAVRLLLIRRPAWRPSEGPLTAFIAFTHPARSWIERLRFTDCRELAQLDLGALDSSDPPALGEPGPGSIHLVCTNGRHDPCCAERGRPVARALSEAGFPEVWESSHLGGDRFAANVVCLPSGVYFGRVTPDDAPGLLTEFGCGLLDLVRYRGRSCFSPLVQAAELIARQHWAERRLDAVRLEGVSETGKQAVAVFRRGEKELLTVAVEGQRGEPGRLTCHAERPTAPWRYVALSVVEGRL